MGKTRILAVDDDLKIQMVIKDYLEDDGYQVQTASNGEECLAAVRKDAIDLILLDMVLPDADGLSLINRIRADTRTPIIVVSGKSDATDRVVGLEMGADDYLVKPFHLRELSARIRTVLRRSEMESAAP